MKPAICTQCGANIEVDESHEAGICRYCNTAFVTEKVIQQYITKHETTHNITNHITKIIQGNEKDEGEDFYQRGLTFLRLEQYPDAEKAFREAVNHAPECGIYHFYLFYAQSEGLKKASPLHHKPSAAEAFFKLADEEEKRQVAAEYGLLTDSDFLDFALDTVGRGLAGEFEVDLGFYLSEAEAILGISTVGAYYKDAFIGKEKTYRKIAAGLIARLKNTGVGLGLDEKTFMPDHVLHLFKCVSRAVIPHMTEEERTEFFTRGGSELFNRLDKGILCLEEVALMPGYKDGVLRIDDPRASAVNMPNHATTAVKHLILGRSFGKEAPRTLYQKRVPFTVEYEEGFDFSRYFREGDLPLPLLGVITYLPASFPMTTATISYGDLDPMDQFNMLLAFPEGFPIHIDKTKDPFAGICLPHVRYERGDCLCTPGILQGNTVYYPRQWKGMQAASISDAYKKVFQEGLWTTFVGEDIQALVFEEPREEKRVGFLARLLGKK